MKKSKKKTNNAKANKIKSINKQTKIMLVASAAFLVLVVIFIFIAQKKGTGIFSSFVGGTEESVVSEYLISYDENGNMIEVDTFTGETKITKADELETLSPRKMQAYESESREKAAVFEMAKEQLDMLLAESKITEEEYYERLSEAEMASIDINEYLYVIDDYILMVDKGVYNSCKQSDFLRDMGDLYNKYNAVINVVDESVEDSTSPYIIFYVSGFAEKDFEDVRYGIAKALSSDNFIFEKNIPEVQENQNIEDMQNEEENSYEEESEEQEEETSAIVETTEENYEGDDDVVNDDADEEVK